MTIKKLIVLVGLCALFAGCSTMGNSQADNVPNTTAGMGERYLLGRGVSQDYQKAFVYFSKAAEEGDVFAQNELGYLYAAGKGTPQDNAKALVWYKQAAEHGLASAQYNVGLMYLYGLGTVPNKVEAMKWFHQSAASRFEPALKAVARYQE